MPLVSSSSATPSKANSDGPAAVVVQAQPELYDSSFPVVQAQAAQGAPIQVAPPVVYASQLAANGAGGVVVVDSNNKFVGASMGSAAPPSYQQDKKNSGKAIASLVCAIVGLFAFVLGVVLGPVAIGLAVSAKNDIKRKPNELKGECMATSGLIIGIIGFVLSIIVIAMWASAQAQAAASTYDGYYGY